MENGQKKGTIMRENEGDVEEEESRLRSQEVVIFAWSLDGWYALK